MMWGVLENKYLKQKEKKGSYIKIDKTKFLQTNVKVLRRFKKKKKQILAIEEFQKRKLGFAKKMKKQSIYISSCKDSYLFQHKNLHFLFHITTFKNIYIKLFILHFISLKFISL